MDISKLTETELEALAYRLLIELQKIQNNIMLVEKQLAELKKVETPVAN